MAYEVLFKYFCKLRDFCPKFLRGLRGIGIDFFVAYDVLPGVTKLRYLF